MGSTPDNFATCYLPSTPKDQSTMGAELTGIIANRGRGKYNMRASGMMHDSTYEVGTGANIA